MRFLLDEMYPPAIADALRRWGHDAVAVAERPDLRGMTDPELFMAAQAERRAVVTENVADFAPLAASYDVRDVGHHGLVFAAPSAYPRGNRRTVGRLVAALHAMAEQFPGSDATSLRLWL